VLSSINRHYLPSEPIIEEECEDKENSIMSSHGRGGRRDKMAMSVVSTLSGRPLSAKRMTMTDQAALDREYRTLKETNYYNSNKQCKLPKANHNIKNKNYKTDMQKKLQNI
jgi:hypothetical protein